MKKKKKKPDPLCRNCLLYDWENKTCKVIVLYEGTRIHVPMDPNDLCLYEDKFTEILPNGKVRDFTPQVEQVRIWVEDPRTGKKTDKDGVVRIEYPENFFPEPTPDEN
jgi:hypothetical protein